MRHSIVERIAHYARETPDAVAVVDEAGRMTYRELDAFSNALAHVILPRKRGAGGYVAVMMPRTRFYIAAAIGALKAGTAYVFVNPLYPADRINYILDEIDPVLLVTTPELWDARAHSLHCPEQSVLTLDGSPLAGADETPVDESTPDQDAFVLYTSGTTGRPKGVVHTMRTIDEWIATCDLSEIRAPRLKEAIIADLGFLVSFVSTHQCLGAGGELHLIGEAMRLDMNRLSAYIGENGLTRAFMGSSMGVKMLRGYDLAFEELHLGGEMVVGMTPEAAAKTRALCRYGMTELYPMTSHRITGEEPVVPAGKALPGVRLHVLDEEMRKVADGTVGDVYAGSRLMARAYLGLPELSAERFIDDPFLPGERLLRTGDRGYFDDNGELVLCGRSDNMVKLRGLRIETGGIEAVAQTFPGMRGTACVLRKVCGEDQLCLYFENDGTVDRAALREHLARKLAAYMIPAAFVRLDQLPRNARGKIDRKALPDPSADDIQLKMEPVASDYESILFSHASRMLGTDRFGVTDDLFALGLTSLRAMELVVKAEKEGVRIKVSDLMNHRTIRGALQHGTRILEWYAPYDPKKDVMVFVCGVTLTVDIPKKLALFAERYNVMTVEPIVEHYRYIFEGDDVEEVVELYYALIDYHLPKGARLKALAGSSWGGKLAYLIAGKWRERRGDAPTVVLGDTIVDLDPSMSEALLNGTFYDWLEERGLDKAAFNSDFVRRQTVLARVESKHLPIPTYAGPVILIHALDHWVFPPENDRKWMGLASDLTILPVDANHNEISMDTPKGLPFWKKAVELS